MKSKITIQVFLLIAMFAMSTSPITVVEAASTGNNELRDAFDVALGLIIESGDWDLIFEDWFPGEPLLDDDTTTATATTWPTPTAGGTLAGVIAAGKIVFGSDTAYPPFESDNGTHIIGFDIDIVKAIAAEMTIAYSTTIVADVMTTDWDPIIPNLLIGEFDAIVSAMTKTAARDQVVDFTRAYYSSSQGVLVGPKDNDTITITSVDHVNDSNIIIGVQTGTTSDLYASALTGNPAVTAYPSFADAITALEAEDVHVVLGDSPVLKFYETTSLSGLKLVDTFSDENFGIAVRHDPVTVTSTETSTETSTDTSTDTSTETDTETDTETETDTVTSTSVSTDSPLPIVPVLFAFIAITILRRKK